MKSKQTTYHLVLIRWLLLLVAFLVVLSLLSLSFFLRPSFSVNRNNKRQQDIEFIMAKISESVLNSGGVMPNLPLAPVQIGRSENSCALSTNWCEIKSDSCINLDNLMSGTEESLPADIVGGDQLHTRYAISMSLPDTIEIIACDAEGTEVVKISKQFPQVEIIKP